MGCRADAHALGDGVGDVEQLAHGLGQQCAHDAGDDDDGTGQGGNAAQLSCHVHADGGGHRLRQQSSVLLLGQVHCQRQCKGAAQTDQRAHRDARDDGGRVLFEQVQLFIQRDSQRHRSGQQQVAYRRGAGLVVPIGDIAHRQKNDDKNTAQQQRVKDGLAGHPVDEHTQPKGCQRKQHAPCHRAGQKVVQQLSHGRPPLFYCGRSAPAWCGLRPPLPAPSPAEWRSGWAAAAVPSLPTAP